MRGTGDDKKWNLGVRWVPGIPVKRAKLRLTGTYAVLDNLYVGLEFNPVDDDLGLLANWRAFDETETLPALILGTSSDRIGTPSGRAFYATFAKDISRWVDLPIAPYVGASYGDFDDTTVMIGGVSINWDEEWRSMHTWDGHNLHHVIDRSIGNGYSAGLVVAEQDDGRHYVGVSVGASL